ncbi:MAG: hypothetical protein ACR2MN_13935 [Acidimicrobiales bacterium]
MIDVIPDATQEAAQKLLQSAEFSYNVVRNNADLTPQAKQAAMARTYAATESKMNALREATSGQATARREAAMRTAFGSPSVDPSAAISARDAADRAGQLGPDDYGQALDLLNRAEMNGDGVLAAAIGWQAWTMSSGGPGGLGYGSAGWSDVLAAYLTNRPQAAKALGDLEASTVKPYIAALAAFWVPIPPELGSLPEYQIAALAAS